MSTNISGQKREALISEIYQIKSFIEQNAKDENAAQLISYLGDLFREVNGKKYGLVFEEHREKIDEILEQNAPVFTEEKDLFIDGGGELNFLLEGDNLASLKLLEKTHRGKIDVIYIDPPYNTGNKDFVYDDDYIDSTDAFKHSKWLSFMEKRLKIAKKLLNDTGVIFLSIDDNEQADLKMLCDEIFGEKKFAAMFPWRKRTAKSDVPFGISQDFEWILCYSSNNYEASIEGKERKYFETDDYPNRAWRFHDMSTQRRADERPNSDFTIINPKNGKEYPVNKMAVWRITKKDFQKYYDEGRIIFPGDYDFLNISKPVLRYWKEDDIKKAGEKFGQIAVSTKLPDTVGMSQDGTKEITDVLQEKAFLYPKSLDLIKYLINISTSNLQNYTVLDFFAGSGTTGHAVLKLNVEDNGHRNFILCTNNENNICRNITYQRMKTVITGKRKDGTKYSDGLPGSLKYFKTDFIPISEKMYYEYADEILLHVRELVELENAINFDKDNSVAIVLDDEEMEEVITKIAGSSPTMTEEHVKTLYMGHDVLLSSKQERILKAHNITVNVIPDYYYHDLAL